MDQPVLQPLSPPLYPFMVERDGSAVIGSFERLRPGVPNIGAANFKQVTPICLSILHHYEVHP